jgi:hypothetical protein
MRTLKLKDICGYLPYSLKVCEKNTGKIFYVLGIELDAKLYHCSDSEYDWWNMDNFKPVLRPLSDLYRAVSHNGKEIVPIVECAKIAYPLHDFQAVGIEENEIYAQCGNRLRFFYNKGIFQGMDGCGKTYPLGNQIVFFNYLHELKVDYGGLIDAGLAIDAGTLDSNPYK